MACDEERWRTHTEESVDGGYTRGKEERTTENKTERCVSTRFEKYWTESRRGDIQGDVEKKDHQLYRRPYMMGKARGKDKKTTASSPVSPPEITSPPVAPSEITASLETPLMIAAPHETLLEITAPPEA